MRPAVVTAVLLLVCILDTVTAEPEYSLPRYCQSYLYPRCAGGWYRIAGGRCVKLADVKKNFNDAQAQCRSLNSDLVSLHSKDEANFLTCVTWYNDNDSKKFWVGAKKTGGVFGFTDGSKFDFTAWRSGRPNNSGDCIESTNNVWSLWNDVPCTGERFFACAKKM